MRIFAQPQYLWLLALVGPALIGFLWWSWSVKQKLARQFISQRLLSGLMVGVSRQREKMRLGLLVAAVVFLFLALARPQWGFVWEEAHQKGLDIIVAVDTSRSMLAQDTPPDRLERAKLAALDLMRLAQSDRLGLIAFAGTAFLQTPLTLDDEAFRQGVDALDVGIIPQGGTALSAAIRTATEAFQKENDNHKVLVLMTDGEDHDIDTETLAAAKEAAESGMMIFTIGVGTPEGELLRVKDSQGNMTFVKDEQGNVVKSHLNQALLRQIATIGKGFYLPLQGADPMKTLYERGLAPLPKTEGETKLTRVYEERYHWPLAIALILLAVEAVLPESTVKHSRRRKTVPAAPAAVAAFALILASAAPHANASPSTAYRDYQHGQYGDAFSEYSRLSSAKTNDYRLHYDAGAAAYQTKEYQKALDQFNATLTSPGVSSDVQTQERAYYDMGNTFYRLGEPASDPDQKQHAWEQAIDSYGHALQLNTNDFDARNNLAYVKQQLEKFKQQQQQQQNKNDKNKNDKDQKQNQNQRQQSQDQKKQDQKKNQQDQQKQQQKQEQAGNDQQKKDEQKKNQEKQQQEQAQQDKDKKDQKAEANASDQRDKKQENGQQAAMAQMTPQEARQLLDAQRDDEKALIFQPTNMPAPPPNVSMKDW